jgi:hypothetical protein
MELTPEVTPEEVERVMADIAVEEEEYEETEADAHPCKQKRDPDLPSHCRPALKPDPRPLPLQTSPPT